MVGDPGMRGVGDEQHAGNRQGSQRITPNAAVDATSFKAAVKQIKICLFF